MSVGTSLEMQPYTLLGILITSLRQSTRLKYAANLFHISFFIVYVLVAFQFTPGINILTRLSCLLAGSI